MKPEHIEKAREHTRWVIDNLALHAPGIEKGEWDGVLRDEEGNKLSKEDAEARHHAVAIALTLNIALNELEEILELIQKARNTKLKGAYGQALKEMFQKAEELQNE